MVRRRKRRLVRHPVIRLSNQQAQGFLSDLAKSAVKVIAPIVKKEVKKVLPKIGKAAGKFALGKARKTKIGKKLGIGLRLAGGRGRGRPRRALGSRSKQVRRRRRKPGVRVIMI